MRKNSKTFEHVENGGRGRVLIVTRVEEETKRLFEHVQNGGRGSGKLLMLNTDRIEE